MNAAEYIKERLNATVLETSLVPQDNGTNIVMERCEIGNYKIVLISDETDNAVVVL